MDNLPPLLNVFIFLALVFLNGFFVAGEFSILHSHPAKLKQHAEKRGKSARSAIWLISKLDLSLTATQLGISVTSLLLGLICIPGFRGLFITILHDAGLTSYDYVAYPLAAAAALLLVMFAHVVWGEITAKSLAMRRPEETLQSVSRLVLLFAQLTRPLIFPITSTANRFLRLFGTSVPAKSERYHSVSELSLLVSQSTERGVLDKDEEKMLRGVFGFSDTIAREVMTPRTDLVAVEATANFEQVMHLVVETGLSRFPVRGEEIDDILGILLVKDLLAAIAKEGAPPKEFNIAKIMREPYFIPGTKPIDDLLNEFKHRKIHLAVVLDEHGGVDGIVTLEDLIEEIVGDIFDESDVQEQAIVVEDNGDVLIDGGYLVADLNERFSLSLPQGDYDTIAGFVFACLGRMAQESDEIVIGRKGPRCHAAMPQLRGAGQGEPVEPVNGAGAKAEEAPSGADESEEDYPIAVIRVLLVENNRIERIRLRKLPPPDDPESVDEQAASEDRGFFGEGEQ